MSLRTISGDIRREPIVLREAMPVADAVRALLDSDLPALPVVGDDDRFVGIFGEREFIGAFFPGYLKTLNFAGFVSKKIEDVLEKRADCVNEPVGEHMNTDHVDVRADVSDVQLAETFLHHRVSVVPVTDGDGKVVAIISRSDFFRSMAARVGT